MASTLTVGSKGAEVTELQNQLIALGFGSYLEPYGADGSYGSTTQKAVEAFQASVGISEKQSASSLKVGDTVTFLGGGVYVDSYTNKPSANRDGGSTCKITYVSKNSHEIHLVSQDCSYGSNQYVYGWVDSANVSGAGAICGPQTWEALRSALNPDPPAVEEETTTPPQDPPILLASDSGLFIMNLITETQINIKYRPEEINDNVSVQFDSETPRGRSVSYTGYRSTENKTVSMTIMLHADLCDDGLENMVNKLKALEYPLYQAGAVVPPNCYVNMYRGIRFSALCTQVDVIWQGDIKNNTYTHAQVTLSFRNTVDSAYTATVVESSGNNG